MYFKKHKTDFEIFVNMCTSSKDDENSSLKTDESLHKVVASIKDVFQEA